MDGAFLPPLWQDLVAGMARLLHQRHAWRTKNGDACNFAHARAKLHAYPFALFMGHILHDWDLDRKKALIAKAYAALPAGGSLIVYESLIDDDRRHNAFGLLMSLNMLLETAGGFDYTGADCSGWLVEAWFRETRVVHLLGPDSMVVGVK